MSTRTFEPPTREEIELRRAEIGRVEEELQAARDAKTDGEREGWWDSQLNKGLCEIAARKRRLEAELRTRETLLQGQQLARQILRENVVTEADYEAPDEEPVYLMPDERGPRV